MESKELVRLIDELENYGLPQWNLLDSKSYWTEFWELCDEIKDSFKNVRFPTKDERQVEWERFNNIRSEARNYKKRQYEELESHSSSHRSYIMQRLSSCGPNDLWGLSPEDANSMKELGAELKDIGRYLSKYKSEMTHNDKQDCFEEINEVREAHNLWWEHYKEEKDKRHEEYLYRVRSRIEDNREKLRRANDAADRTRSHIDDLHDKISDAWNDDFRDRAEGWLSEAEDKLNNIEEWIEKLEDWISVDESKL